MIESSLVTVLLADTSVTDLVDDRITPVAVRLEAGLPAVTFARQSGSREWSFDGAAAAAATVYVLLTAWATEWPAARTLAEAMRAALDGYSGGDIVVASVTDGADTYDRDADLFGCAILVQIEFEEA